MARRISSAAGEIKHGNIVITGEFHCIWPSLSFSSDKWENYVCTGALFDLIISPQCQVTHCLIIITNSNFLFHPHFFLPSSFPATFSRNHWSKFYYPSLNGCHYWTGSAQVIVAEEDRFIRGDPDQLFSTFAPRHTVHNKPQIYKVNSRKYLLSNHRNAVL